MKIQLKVPQMTCGGCLNTICRRTCERVRLLMKFEKYSGLFAYHCHTLEHEDAGMMRNYRVKEGNS